MELNGKVALVTGGGRGIGRAIALGLAAAGADVCVAARTRSEIEAVAAEIAARGSRSLARTCDVCDAVQTAEVVGSLMAEWGRLDILVNNAGGHWERETVTSSDPDRWRKVMEVHLLGAYHCSRAALPH